MVKLTPNILKIFSLLVTLQEVRRNWLKECTQTQQATAKKEKTLKM